MKKNIIGLVTIFFIFIICDTYSAVIGAQVGFWGSGIQGGGGPDPLKATLLMPHIMPSSPQPNATSINRPGTGTFPQMNFLMDPVFSPLIPGGTNNIKSSPGGIISIDNNPMTGLGLAPIMGLVPSAMRDIGPLTLMGLAHGPVMGIDPLNSMGFGPATIMGSSPPPIMGFGDDPFMGIGPFPIMGLPPGPMMGLPPGPMMNVPYNILSPGDLSLPFKNLSPLLKNLSKPHTIPTIPVDAPVNNPNTNPGRKQPDQTGNKRLIFLGTSVEGTRPDGTSYIVKHYLDTYTNKQICGYSQGLELTVPDYNWWYGCAPTSAGMMMGYYDMYGYNGTIYDLIPGGVAEASSFYPNSPFPIDNPSDPPGPSGPTLLCNKAIASTGHLADFWLSYGSTGDPLASGRTIPSQFDCLADFMGTSQDNLTSTGEANPDGQTFFYFWTDGARMTNTDLFNLGYDVYNHSGTYGMIEYTQYCGYSAFAYNQYILGFQGNTLGFSFSDYVNEIDSGRPVMIHLTGHMMLGVGYYLSTETVIVHDTWTNSSLAGPLTMTWGDTYKDPDGITFTHYAVSCFTPI